jgi:hypothetical protein
LTDEPAETVVTPRADGQPDGTPVEHLGASADTPPQESVGEVLNRLYQDGRAYASAEAERQKLRLGIVGVGVRNAAILGIIALILVFSSIVALLVGLVITLAQDMAPIWATLIVVGGALAVAMILLLLAKNCISRMAKAIKP